MYRNTADFSWSGIVQKLAIVSTVVIFMPSYDREMRLIAIAGSALLWLTWSILSIKSRG